MCLEPAPLSDIAESGATESTIVKTVPTRNAKEKIKEPTGLREAISYRRESRILDKECFVYGALSLMMNNRIQPKADPADTLTIREDPCPPNGNDFFKLWVCFHFLLQIVKTIPTRNVKEKIKHGPTRIRLHLFRPRPAVPLRQTIFYQEEDGRNVDVLRGEAVAPGALNLSLVGQVCHVVELGSQKKIQAYQNNV